MQVETHGKSWQSALKVYLEGATLRMLFLGFSAGLPLVLVLGTLGFWLREAGIDRATIGFLSWIGLAYGFKWVWAPLVDRLSIPGFTRWLGRRRSWLLLSQLVIIAGLIGMGMHDPRLDLSSVVGCTLAVAFGSATQDIALDAFRIESAGTERQGALAAAYQTGYRLAMLWAGAGALGIAAAVSGSDSLTYSHKPWQLAYAAMAVSMLVGVITVLLSPEPTSVKLRSAKRLHEWLNVVLVAPFTEFVGRYRWYAILLLVLIATYRISDVVMGIMANPFYVDLGYTKLEVASVSKLFGVIMTIVGTIVGGAMAVRLGVMRVLMLGAVLCPASNLLFSWLASHGHDINALIFVISLDNFSSGIASAAFVAYLSSLTNVRYSATQYALFSSLMLMMPKFLAGYSGVYVDLYGYHSFFVTTALLGLPAIALVWLVARVHAPDARGMNEHDAHVQARQ
ncbi:AmpG family muropeptide MFS transporter [Pandoraea iniqua]|uniref:AmpG family muropeptide MFS transporter n=1 Tax=Pandoraea iniqua TaxID=2508288 RepID=A0A5E4YJQ4_9BURK|nr:MFS transporter [Pandoraea iniqua]VVE48742.1 AmpG family muropeptide MFS transporter [Pandoraea iniqua]